jgi:periplasmic divalent cation tolerance protein
LSFPLAGNLSLKKDAGQAGMTKILAKYLNDPMNKMTEHIVVLITAPNEEEAAKLAKELVADRLAACVNIIRNLRSIYRWQGKIEDGNEVLMVAKTRRDLFESLLKKVKELHSYSVPEVIALPIIAGSEDYLKWLAEETVR